MRSYYIENGIFDAFETVFKSYFSSNSDGHVWFDKENEEYNVKIPAPGWTKDEINIEVDTDKLLISTEFDKDDDRKNFGVNSFKYQIKIRNIDSNSVDAALENGILTLKFKILVDKTRKKVKVK